MQCATCALARIKDGRIYCGSGTIKDWTHGNAETQTCPGYAPGPPTYLFMKKPRKAD